MAGVTGNVLNEFLNQGVFFTNSCSAKSPEWASKRERHTLQFQ